MVAWILFREIIRITRAIIHLLGKILVRVLGFVLGTTRWANNEIIIFRIRKGKTRDEVLTTEVALLCVGIACIF